MIESGEKTVIATSGCRAFAEALDAVARPLPQWTGMIRRVCVDPPDRFWEELCLALRDSQR